MKSAIKKHLLPFLIILSLQPLLPAVDLTLRLMPSYEFPVDNFLNEAGGAAVNLGLEIAPITVRGRDKIYAAGLFSYGIFPVESFGIQSLLDGDLALGYNFRINDRFSVWPEATAGFWSFISSDTFQAKSSSGISFGGKLGADFHLSPALSISAFGGYKCFYSKPEPFMNNIQAGLGIRYNLTRGLFKPNQIEMTESEVDSLFPVFYSHYTDNSFGSLTFVNNEENKITDVEVSVYIDSYMVAPYTVTTIPVVEMGESFTTPVFAFLNENILGLLQPKGSDMEVIVSYFSLGKKQETSYSIPVTALSRNSMTWEDDRRAAAFVSGKDAAAQTFARQVQAVVKSQLRSDIPENLQYAAALFGALKAFGINYVVDPSSAFTDNVGTASVDFLQFPYQTLIYHGGDCDDLTILNCSLLEAIGIETAFITVPGHIYMAFDSGLSLEQGRQKTSKGYYIEADGKIWVPLEITLSQDTFKIAWLYGAREWKKAGENAVLIPLKDAWSTYLPISVPGSGASIDIPSSDVIIKYFKEANYY